MDWGCVGGMDNLSWVWGIEEGAWTGPSVCGVFYGGTCCASEVGRHLTEFY